MVTIVMMVACSSGTSIKKESIKQLSELNETDRTDLVRKNIMAYCEEKGGDVIFNYFQAFNREYTNRQIPEDGAFSKISVLIDSIDFKDGKIHNYGKRKAPIAEVSLMLNSTQKRYKNDAEFGNIGIHTGIDFLIDDYGKIIGHKGYTEFEKGFYYYSDADKFKLSDLFLGF
jgi:hypothetical protein